MAETDKAYLIFFLKNFFVCIMRFWGGKWFYPMDNPWFSKSRISNGVCKGCKESSNDICIFL